MSINSESNTELANHRKLVSDQKDSGNDLSIPGTGDKNSRNQAALAVRNLKSRMEVNSIIMSESDEVYFTRLFKGNDV
jgi:hypothetical protein